MNRDGGGEGGDEGGAGGQPNVALLVLIEPPPSSSSSPRITTQAQSTAARNQRQVQDPSAEGQSCQPSLENQAQRCCGSGKASWATRQSLTRRSLSSYVSALRSRHTSPLVAALHARLEASILTVHNNAARVRKHRCVRTNLFFPVIILRTKRWRR